KQFPHVELREAAVWRSDQKTTSISLHPHGHPEFTQGYSTTLVRSVDYSWTVNAIGLDEILAELGHVDLLKIDCEGAEWPIFYTSRSLCPETVTRIAGEYHQDACPELAGEEPEGGWPPWNIEGLLHWLTLKGYRCLHEPRSTVHGFFWAESDKSGGVG
ncbi:MAG: FkbM family methyltransferase, partial [Planctomycetaceae bacterium]|nr:FkbM family methyltransferase [Planctomycetaceae bacterium]